MIIDAHVHLWKRPMLPDSMLRAYLEPLLALDGMFDLSDDKLFDWPMSQVLPEDLIEGNGHANIDKSVILPLDFGLVETPRTGIEEYNDWVFESAALYPDKMIPFVGIDPNRGSEAIRLVDKYVKKFDARGIKVYPGTGFYPNEERLMPFWKHMNEYGLMVTSHAGAAWGPLEEKYNRPSYFSEVLDKCHDLKIIIAHMGGKFREEMYQLVTDYPNAYTDCSALQGWLPSNPEVAVGRLKEASQRIPDKILFGSDWPLFDLAFSHAKWVEFIQVSDWAGDEMKEKILGGNFVRMARR